MVKPFNERRLVFEGKVDIDEYLNENNFNKELYNIYIAIKDSSFFGDRIWRHSAIDTFNEVYYQCTRIVNDPHPESNVRSEYLEDTQKTFGTEFAQELVFCMVKVVLSLQMKRRDNVDFFLKVLNPLIQYCPYYNSLEQFRNNYYKEKGLIDTDFTPHSSEHKVDKDTEPLLQQINKLEADVNRLTRECNSLKQQLEEKIPEKAFNTKTNEPCFTSRQMGILLTAVGRLTEKDNPPGKTTLGEIVNKIAGYKAKTARENMKGSIRKSDTEAVAKAIESKFPNLAAEVRKI